MAVRRFNFLARNKILQDHVAIRVKTGSRGRVESFVAECSLDDYRFPPGSKVIVEAKTLFQRLRFPLGVIGGVLERSSKNIAPLNADRVRFTLLVIDPNSSRKLGVAETVRPLDESGEDGGQSLLPVEIVDDLSGPLWAIRFEADDEAGQTDAPILAVVRAAVTDSATTFLREPRIRALIMPAILQQILTRTLLSGGEYEPDPEGLGWRDAWVRMATRWAGREVPKKEASTPLEYEYDQAAYEWINDAVKEFAKQAELLDRYLREVNA